MHHNLTLLPTIYLNSLVNPRNNLYSNPSLIEFLLQLNFNSVAGGEPLEWAPSATKEYVVMSTSSALRTSRQLTK